MRADSKTVLRQLKTARGQLEGIIKMVEENRYCIDISNQVLATRALLERTNRIILEGHIEGCILDAAATGSEEERKEKIFELSNMIKKMMK
jgi:hypothetical protein|nr:metal-sensing transcriptional repressor [uncultured Lachnoanaerobaculum sp.]